MEIMVIRRGNKVPQSHHRVKEIKYLKLIVSGVLFQVAGSSGPGVPLCNKASCGMLPVAIPGVLIYGVWAWLSDGRSPILGRVSHSLVVQWRGCDFNWLLSLFRGSTFVQCIEGKRPQASLLSR